MADLPLGKRAIAGVHAYQDMKAKIVRRQRHVHMEPMDNHARTMQQFWERSLKTTAGANARMDTMVIIARPPCPVQMEPMAKRVRTMPL